MGHITALGHDPNETQQRALKVRELLGYRKS